VTFAVSASREALIVEEIGESEASGGTTTRNNRRPLLGTANSSFIVSDLDQAGRPASRADSHIADSL